jgi:hypothetical protein
LAFSFEGKDGSVRKFGGTGGTVFGHIVGLYSPLSGTVQAQGWLQTDLADAAGNAVTYTYTTIDAIGERYLQDVTWSGGRVHFGYTASQRTDVAYSPIG